MKKISKYLISCVISVAVIWSIAMIPAENIFGIINCSTIAKATAYESQEIEQEYDFKITTDETISLNYSAKKKFSFTLSDSTIAQITSIQSSSTQIGSTIQMTSSITITPIKPGYVTIYVIDTYGSIITQSVLLIEEGSHQLRYSSTIKDPTCTEDGIDLYKCKFCDYQEEMVSYSYGHWYMSEITVQSSCIKEGVRTYTCSICNDSYTETIEATGHNYEGIVTTQPTCTEEGKKTYTCSTCDDSYTETIEKTEHSYSEDYTIDSQATCETDGSKSRHCTTDNCTAKTDITVISATGHNYTETIMLPSYTEQGYTYHECSICGDNYKDNFVEKLTLSNISGFSLGGRASNALRLNWTKNASADGYIIEQYKDGKWVRIKKITSNATTTYRVTGLAAGTAYKFRMRAYVMDGTKALYSSYTSTLAARTTPSNVTGLKIGGRASNALRLNWTKNTSADGYIIEQYKDGKWVRIKKITSNATTTYRIAGLKASTQYKFRVKAYKMSGSTALYSGYTSTLSAYTNPSKVANLKITGKAGTALRLGWSKNTSADGYIIEMYSGGKWVRIAKITSNATLTYRKAGLKKGTTYKFRVRTYNMVGKTALYGGYVNVNGTTNK